MVAARGSSSFLDGAQVTHPLPSLRRFLCQSLVDQYSGCICDTQGTLTSSSLPQTMRDVTVATFCSIQHQDPGSGVLWKFWKCAKEKPERRQGAASVLKCNEPADMETLNSLILKKVSSLFCPKLLFHLVFVQVLSLKSVPNVYTEQLKRNTDAQKTPSSDVTAVDNYSEVNFKNSYSVFLSETKVWDSLLQSPLPPPPLPSRHRDQSKPPSRPSRSFRPTANPPRPPPRPPYPSTNIRKAGPTV